MRTVETHVDERREAVRPVDDHVRAGRFGQRYQRIGDVWFGDELLADRHACLSERCRPARMKVLGDLGALSYLRGIVFVKPTDHGPICPHRDHLGAQLTCERGNAWCRRRPPTPRRRDGHLVGPCTRLDVLRVKRSTSRRRNRATRLDPHPGGPFGATATAPTTTTRAAE